MHCANMALGVAGTALVAAGIGGMVFGFFRGLLDERAREGAGLLVFVLGITAIALGGWLLRLC
jgi:hypothetical protein